MSNVGERLVNLGPALVAKLAQRCPNVVELCARTYIMSSALGEMEILSGMSNRLVAMMDLLSDVCLATGNAQEPAPEALAALDQYEVSTKELLQSGESWATTVIGLSSTFWVIREERELTADDMAKIITDHVLWLGDPDHADIKAVLHTPEAAAPSGVTVH